ncbi:Mitotic spindle-associated MMXD complex subunit MIP18 [Quaeritorhiza haematococci]|nr:Mitotic spindle-associated MMXD complex subunit MIP18 [Quaeritorhiza haematococci]
MDVQLQNANPTVYEVKASTRSRRPVSSRDKEGEDDDEYIDENVVEPFDRDEIFDLVRNINDPEHPLTLEQLNVTQLEHIDVDDENNHVRVRFTPTIPHCSMATLIGLAIRVRLMRSLPERFKVDVLVREGTHQSENAVNKQLNDKERVAAALENTHLLEVVNQCIATTIDK